MQLNRIDQNKLYPKFLELIKTLLVNCQNRGYTFFAISAYRSPEEQSKLYAIGRTSAGKVVTNAKAYESYHNFGLAVDLCHDLDHKKENGLQPSWDMAAYKVLQEEAHKLGLTSGLDFKSFPEGPHIQYKSSLSLAQMKELVLKGGLSEVWNKL